MKRTVRHISISVILFAFVPTIVCSQDEAPPEETKYGALAIDRGNGLYYGWAIDCLTLAEAEKNAIEECNEKGGDCSVVLSFSGTACAAYRFITGNVGMGYGWGIALTAEEADAMAKKECAERSYGLPAPNSDGRCISQNAGDLKVIYDAHDELKLTLPGGVTDY
jgi:hypothetical protein